MDSPHYSQWSLRTWDILDLVFKLKDIAGQFVIC